MTKAEVLQALRQLAAEQAVSEAEVLAALRSTGGRPSAQDARFSHILLYIGGAIVFLGVSVLIWQHWSALNDFTKVLATLGSGLAAYLAGTLLSRQPPHATLGRAFHFIGALVIPLGLHVTLDVAGADVGRDASQTMIAGLVLLMYTATYLLDRRTVFMLFMIIFGTWCFLSATSWMVGSNPAFGWEFSAYRILAVGLVYGLLGYAWSDGEHASLTGALYGFGAMAFLGAAFALGDWQPNQNGLWELAFPGLAFGILFLSVPLKSRALLTFSSLYLMAYIVKITWEYFAGSLGWPLALVLTGLGLMAVGYLHVRVKRTYLA